MTRNNSFLIGNKFALGNKPNKASFKIGHQTWNKGIKGSVKPNKTSFVKGQISSKRMPIGTITTRIDKNDTKRKWIKIEEPNKWIEYAKFVWVKFNGDIPNGFIIHHIDENSLNDAINNLIPLTRSVHFKTHNIGILGWNARKINMAERRIHNEAGLI